jgi:hypothetical protein
MDKKKLLIRVLGAAAAMILAGSAAHAQATRTWVSGVGDDANPCSRTAPCKTFAGAISKTAAGGEIDALDPGGFGTVTITKSIKISAPPGYGSILNSGTNGIVVNAAATDVVTLQGIYIQGGVSGVNGVRFLAGGALIIQNSIIENSSGGFGIDFSPSGASTLDVVNTYITANGTPATTTGGGIIVRPQGGTGSAIVNLKGVRVVRNTFGIRGEGATASAAGVKITAIDSDFINNGFGGVIALTTASPVNIVLQRVTSANNGSNGINANGSGASVVFGGSIITGNATGILTQNGAVTQSYNNSQVTGNGVNGAPTSTIPLM